MKPLETQKAIYMSTLEIVQYYKPQWNLGEIVSFMLTNLGTVNPTKSDLLNKCNEILL